MLLILLPTVTPFKTHSIFKVFGLGRIKPKAKFIETPVKLTVLLRGVKLSIGDTRAYILLIKASVQTEQKGEFKNCILQF